MSGVTRLCLRRERRPQREFLRLRQRDRDVAVALPGDARRGRRERRSPPRRSKQQRRAIGVAKRVCSVPLLRRSSRRSTRVYQTRRRESASRDAAARGACGCLDAACAISLLAHPPQTCVPIRPPARLAVVRRLWAGRAGRIGVPPFHTPPVLPRVHSLPVFVLPSTPACLAWEGGEGLSVVRRGGRQGRVLN